MNTTDKFILAIDQGTSSSRAVIYNHEGTVVANSQQEFTQHYPQPGWVEHDPNEILESVLNVTKNVLDKTGSVNFVGLGITNQRETTLIWDRVTGECIYNAIVWQDRRTADVCSELKDAGSEKIVTAKTGLCLDPYFSATKIAWILDNVEGAREKAEAGDLAFGTVDSFLLWHLTGGKEHATDATNASRTALFNIHNQCWDPELLKLFNVPATLLPEVKDCASDYGLTSTSVIGLKIPICAIAGDQQAALIGQAGFFKGMIKSTYGTGCFVISNTGDVAVQSSNNLLTTVAYRLEGKTTYGLEGSIFVAGSAIQWLRDELNIINKASESENIAVTTGIVDNIHVVPAFAGLGAPYWDPQARGAILGLSRDSGINEIVTATLQGIAFQTADLMDAMSEDDIHPSVIRVDGGMVNNNWFLQFLADILNLTVERPSDMESTVRGVAYLAGLHVGLYQSIDDICSLWSSERVFSPMMDEKTRNNLIYGWRNAINTVRNHK